MQNFSKLTGMPPDVKFVIFKFWFDMIWITNLTCINFHDQNSKLADLDYKYIAFMLHLKNLGHIQK